VRVARPTVPTILLPFKITVKGAPFGASVLRTADLCAVTLPGKPIGTYQVGRGSLVARRQSGYR
jgi:hypothetical protein